MQAINYERSHGDYYLSFNPHRHAQLSVAQDAICDALELIATGDPQVIASGVDHGRICGCKARRLDSSEVQELAESRAQHTMERVCEPNINPKTGRWRQYKWIPKYDDCDLEHWVGYYSDNVVVLETLRVNRKGKAREAWAHVCYDDPADAAELLAIVDGEVPTGIPDDPGLFCTDSELVPVECYAA